MLICLQIVGRLRRPGHAAHNAGLHEIVIIDHRDLTLAVHRLKFSALECLVEELDVADAVVLGRDCRIVVLSPARQRSPTFKRPPSGTLAVKYQNHVCGTCVMNIDMQLFRTESA